VSTCRDSLPADQRPVTTRDEAIARAAQEFADAQAERGELAATQGPRAVAEAAWPVVAGLVPAAEIEQQYRAMQDKARKRAQEARR
jgi:hypothetical protein